MGSMPPQHYSRRSILGASTLLASANLLTSGARAAVSGTVPSNTLLSEIEDLSQSIVADALSKSRKVRRIVNPALIKSPGNPHFSPTGKAFDRVEMLTYAPRGVSGRGV